MPAFVKVTWNDGWLRAATLAAQKSAVEKSAMAARVKCEWRHVRDGIIAHTTAEVGTVASTNPDGGLLTAGAPPHVEESGRVAHFVRGDGGFASGPIHHPGFAGHPFLDAATEVYPAAYVESLRGMI